MTALFDPLLRPAGFAPRQHARPQSGHVRVRRPIEAARPVSGGVSGQARRHVRHPAAPVHGRTRPVSPAVYRRRRRTVGLLAAVLVSAVAWMTLGEGAFASDPGALGAATPRTMVVSRGDTLWDIARTLKPEGSLGELVAELVRLNGVRLEPGQVVILP